MADEILHVNDPGLWSKTSWIQIGYGVWVNLTQVGIGLAFGMHAVTVAQLLAKGSLMSINEESWIATVLTLSAPIGCLISGSVMDQHGRRIMLLISQVPMLVGWFYMASATTSGGIILGRTITGVGCGMAIIPSRIYTTEMCLPNMRGVIGVFPDIAIAIGITIQGGLGSVIPWGTTCYIYGFYAMILLIINYYLPETPYYILLKDDTDDVKRTLAHFRSRNYELDTEIDLLVDFKIDNTIRRLKGKEIRDAFFKRSAYQPFGITTVYFIIAELSGVNIMMLWTIEILSLSKSSTDPHEANLILASTRVIVAVLVAMMLFKIGKKPLALVSALGVGFICIGFGVYLHYRLEPNIFPQIYYIAYITFATFGYCTLPYLIMAELYPLQVRGIMAGISIAFVSVLMFATNKCFPYIRESLGIDNTLIMFGVSSLLGSLFLYFYLPETQFLMLQDIEEYYNERRPTLVSQRRVKSLQLRDAGRSNPNLSTSRELSGSRSSNIRRKSSIGILAERRRKRNKKKQKKENEDEEAEPPEKNKALRLGHDSDSDVEDSAKQKANTI